MARVPGFRGTGLFSDLFGGREPPILPGPLPSTAPAAAVAAGQPLVVSRLFGGGEPVARVARTPSGAAGSSIAQGAAFGAGAAVAGDLAGDILGDSGGSVGVGPGGVVVSRPSPDSHIAEIVEAVASNPVLTAGSVVLAGAVVAEFAEVLRSGPNPGMQGTHLRAAGQILMGASALLGAGALTADLVRAFRGRDASSTTVIR